MNVLAAYVRVPLIRYGLLALVLAAVALAGLEHWAWGPSRQRLAAARVELAALQSEAAALRARVDGAASYDALAELLAEVDKRFRAKVDRAGVVARMTDISAASGTRIIHSANSFGEEREGIAPVLQDITIEGAYPAIENFLNELAAIETLTLIRSAEFSANQDGSQVRLKLRLMTLNAKGGT